MSVGGENTERWDPRTLALQALANKLHPQLQCTSGIRG